MTPHITFHSEFFQPDVVRIDLIAEDLPRHFLGTAFDLHLSGKWKFDHDELCGVFTPKDPNVFQLVSPQPQNGKVVFGLAVAGGGFDNPAGGCLASFYFHVKEFQTMEVSFDHARVSVYQNGRRDLPDVRWEGGFLNPHFSTQQTEITQQVSGSQEFAPQTVRSLQTDLLHSLRDPSLANVYIVLLIALGLALAVFFGVLAYFRLRRKD